MNSLKFAITTLCFLFNTALFAQVQINKQIQLTGSGTDGKVTGIRSVTDSLDATSAEVVQNGSLIYAVATGSNNNFNITVSPPVAAYKAGRAFNFISNQNIISAATLNVNNLGAIPIKKIVTQDLTGCEILNGQVVTVVYDGTNFQITSYLSGSSPTIANAGPDSLNLIDTTTIMAGNTPTSGTGLWTVVSGTGGSFATPTSPTSAFTGLGGNSYVLKWTITSCFSSSATVTKSFQPTGVQTFGYTGGQQTFTVPSGVTKIGIDIYGAQGGAAGTFMTGGLGGYAHGTLSVTPGETLYIYVGGQPNSATGGFNGGGTGAGNGMGGGGGSDIRVGATDLGSRVLIAGGGGGSTNGWNSAGGTGGGLSGGYCTGGAGAQFNGLPGNQIAGGAGESNYNDSGAGTLGQGGNGGHANNSGGAGGGGYYGGGGGDAGGGGGGSGYIGNIEDGFMQNGLQSGNGQVILTW